MARGTHLGEFELYVLLALDHIGDEAYGVTIRDEIERRSGRPASIGAVYAALGRLEDKGYTDVEVSDPLPMRGGRARRYVRLTPLGRRTLRETARTIGRMLDGVSWSWRPGKSR